MLLRVWRFRAGSSVTHRNSARGSPVNPRSADPSSMASITAVAITVLPAPVTAERAKADRLSCSAQSARPRPSRFSTSMAACRW